MQINENFPLKQFTTFGIEACARRFVSCTSVDEIKQVLSTNNDPLLVLGGGSNILFTSDWEGIVLKNDLKGIEVLNETETTITIKVAAGEVWEDFVSHCVNNSWYGIENLALIPGNVGASPMQNIGAYGAEVKQVIDQVYTLKIDTLTEKIFTNAECKFGYRSSIFKHEQKGKYIITAVSYKLNKQPALNTSYGAIESELAANNITSPTIQDVFNAVCAIRRSKLPDPTEIGNAGSFFKNPVVPEDHFEQLKQDYPTIVAYPAINGVKLAAGWLIDQCGWKGVREGDAGVHEKQALVLGNYGEATGLEIISLAGQIQEDVFNKFGVNLEMEVNVY